MDYEKIMEDLEKKAQEVEVNVLIVGDFLEQDFDEDEIEDFECSGYGKVKNWYDLMAEQKYKLLQFVKEIINFCSIDYWYMCRQAIIEQNAILNGTIDKDEFIRNVRDIAESCYD
jgi:hypothetical protein